MNDYSEALAVHAQSAAALRRMFYERDLEIIGADRNSEDFLKHAASRVLDVADTYYCAADIQVAISTIARTMPDNWTLVPERLPTIDGFMVFESPLPWNLPLYDHPVQAIGWMTSPEEGIVLLAFCLTGRVAYPAQSKVWMFGKSIGDSTEQPTREHVRWVATLLEFLGQRIVVRSQRVASRPAQRNAARQNFQHSPIVNVVELRRREHHYTEREGQPNPREWSCQWLVRGHWRQQWYPSLGTHQPRWIEPYAKGPNDKPLKSPSAQIFAVVR